MPNRCATINEITNAINTIDACIPYTMEEIVFHVEMTLGRRFSVDPRDVRTVVDALRKKATCPYMDSFVEYDTQFYVYYD